MKIAYSYFRTEMGSDQLTLPPFQIHVKSEKLKFKFHQFTFKKLSNNFVSMWLNSFMPYISEILISLLFFFLYTGNHFL